MRVRLKDIAKLANTSEATVSLVLNGRHYHRVSDSLRKQIESIAAELGYQPNRQAQLLASGRTKTVGVLVNTLTNSFFSRYIGLLEDRLADHGYHVQPAETRSDPSRLRHLFGMVAQRMADAVISLTDTPERDSADPANGLVLRLESFGEETPDTGVPGVAVDYREATGEMFAHLAANGARRIALLMAAQHDPANETVTPRARCFLEQLDRTGVQFDDRRVAAISETSPFTHWYEATREMLERDSKTDSMFIHNAHVAPPVLRAIQDCGRTVGKDIAVATYDDPASARWLGPGLSVVREPAEEVADGLTDIVLSTLDGRPAPVAPQQLFAAFVARPSSNLA